MELSHRHKILSLFLLIAPLMLMAQTGMRVKASVDRNSILIGERITLTYEADIPETQQIRFITIDTIDHFEFIDHGKIDTVNTSTGTLLRQKMVITSFDSGQWVIPSYILDAQNDIKTDSFIINVRFTPFDTSQAYHDIKDIIEVESEEEKEEKENWYWYAGAGLLFLIALLYVLFRKKQKPPPIIQAKDPYEEAIERLDVLKTEKGLSSKEYYTKLTDIFRNYLARRKNISSMQKITDELVMQLQQLAIPLELNKQLSMVLRTTDFVKFAKYIPSKSDDDAAFNTIKEAIMVIEKLPGA